MAETSWTQIFTKGQNFLAVKRFLYIVFGDCIGSVVSYMCLVLLIETRMDKVTCERADGPEVGKLLKTMPLQETKEVCGSLRHHSNVMFYNSGCGISSKTLLQFRIFAAIFHWGILGIRLTENERLFALHYLTNIVYTLCALYYTLAAYNSLTVPEETIPFYHKLSTSDQVFRMDKLCYEDKAVIASVRLSCRIQWMLHSMALTLGILVSFMYFLLIYNPETETLGITNIARHILNSIFIITEFSFNMVAVKFSHIVYSLVLASCYTIYTFFFWLIVEPPDNYIYRIVDWDKPSKTGSLIVMLMCAAGALNAILVGASKIKFKYIFPAHDPSFHSFLV